MLTTKENKKNTFWKDEKSLSFAPKTPFRKRNWLLASLFVVFLAWVSYLIFDENGKADIEEGRKKALQKELEKFEDSEQYVLTARRAAFFPCLNGECDSIWLQIGEVYKYGVTKNGQKGRGYSENYLKTSNLEYFVQYKGALQECMKQEKIKIYYYPTLPENLQRSPKKRLNRPPANPQDR